MKLFNWFRALRNRSRLDVEMAAEMQSHLQDRADDLIARGLTPGAAERRARIEFGNIGVAQEECRETRGLGWIEAALQDARFGARMLRKSPGYTATAALTLALGIGACATVFTLVQSVLLRRAPIRDASRVVVVWDTSAARGLSRIGPNGLDYLDWREQSRSFDDLFLFEHGTGTITGGGEPLQVAGLRVTPNFTNFFGIQPILGHAFGAAEWQSERHVVLLTQRFWRQRYGGDPAVIGRGMELNGVAYTIAGVIPASLNTVFNIDIVVPFDYAWVRRADGDLGVLGRLKRGIPLAQANAEMNGIMRRMSLDRPDRRSYGAVLVPLDDVRVASIRPALWMLFGVVGFVLLMAFANVANLMLGRAAGRRREFALRGALGASRGRLLRQCLVESGLLAFLGGAGGWLLAAGGIHVLASKLPASIPVPNGADRVPMPPIHMDGAVLAFTAAMALLTVLVGLAPAAAAGRDSLNATLKAGGREASATPQASRMHGRFVIAQCALATLLLIGAGQMIAGFHRMLATDLGVRTTDIVTLRIKLANDAAHSPYKEASRQGEAYRLFLRSVRRVPGVQSAALTEIIPLSQDDMDRSTFLVQEAPPLAPGVTNPADFRGISPGFTETMGIPLLAGRTFTDADDAGHPNVVVIDAALARHYFNRRNPIGEHIRVGGSTGTSRQIIGVVGSVRDLGFAQEPVPTVYYPYLQSPLQSMGLVVRTRMPMAAIVPALKTAIHDVDANQPVFSPRSMSDIVEGTISAQRLALLFLNAFAFLALALTLSGMYGVTAYAVRQRTQEIGVRMALGARPAAVMNLILGKGLRLALWGALYGGVAAAVLLRLVAHRVYGLDVPGPEVLIASAALLTATGLAASALPARRAMRLDPVKALRCE